MMVHRYIQYFITATCLSLLISMLVITWKTEWSAGVVSQIYDNAPDVAASSSLPAALIYSLRKAAVPILPEAPGNDTELVRALWRYLENPELGCRKLRMFGGIAWPEGEGAIDGDKFVCLDPAFAPDPAGCLVYSFGINDEWSFDRDMCRYGCEVHAFDPSMAETPEQRMPFGAWFHRTGLGGRTGRDQRGWQVMTLPDIRRKLGHTNRTIDYLKVDIEGDEWSWLAADDGSLQHVRQIGMEVHLSVTSSALRRQYAALRHISRAGFRTVHSNVNRVVGRMVQLPGLQGNVSQFHELVWVKV